MRTSYLKSAANLYLALGISLCNNCCPNSRCGWLFRIEPVTKFGIPVCWQCDRTCAQLQWTKHICIIDICSRDTNYCIHFPPAFHRNADELPYLVLPSRDPVGTKASTNDIFRCNWKLLCRQAAPLRGAVQCQAIKALLFDCDGVIIESEELHRLAYNAAFENFDVKVCKRTLASWSTRVRHAKVWMGRQLDENCAHLPIYIKQLHHDRKECSPRYTDKRYQEQSF